MNSAHPTTEMGLAVRVEFKRGEMPRLWACPIRIFGIDPIPLVSDPQRKANEARFWSRLQAVTRRVGKASIGPAQADGCAPVLANSP
jgi:hypothetical protein